MKHGTNEMHENEGRRSQVKASVLLHLHLHEMLVWDIPLKRPIWAHGSILALCPPKGISEGRIFRKERVPSMTRYLCMY